MIGRSFSSLLSYTNCRTPCFEETSMPPKTQQKCYRILGFLLWYKWFFVSLHYSCSFRQISTNCWKHLSGIYKYLWIFLTDKSQINLQLLQQLFRDTAWWSFVFLCLDPWFKENSLSWLNFYVFGFASPNFDFKHFLTSWFVNCTICLRNFPIS